MQSKGCIKTPAKTHVLSLPGFCSAHVLGKVGKRAGDGCACLIWQPGSQQGCPLLPAGQRAHRVFIAQKSVPVTAPEGKGDAPTDALPTWLAPRSSSAGGGAGDGHQHLGSMGRSRPSRRAPASPVALPAGLVPYPCPSTFLLPPSCPGSRDLWDTQICSRVGITSSLWRAHNLLLLSGPRAPLGMLTSSPRQPTLKWGLCPGANTLLPNIISSFQSPVPPVFQHLEMSFPNSCGTKALVEAERRGAWQGFCSPPIL